MHGGLPLFPRCSTSRFPPRHRRRHHPPSLLLLLLLLPRPPRVTSRCQSFLMPAVVEGAAKEAEEAAATVGVLPVVAAEAPVEVTGAGIVRTALPSCCHCHQHAVLRRPVLRRFPPPLSLNHTCPPAVLPIRALLLLLRTPMIEAPTVKWTYRTIGPQQVRIPPPRRLHQSGDMGAARRRVAARAIADTIDQQSQVLPRRRRPTRAVEAPPVAAMIAMPFK